VLDAVTTSRETPPVSPAAGSVDIGSSMMGLL
jgi:hypothetical protein